MCLCACGRMCELAGNLNEHAVNEATRDREKQQCSANSGHPREGMHRGFMRQEWKWVMEKGGSSERTRGRQEEPD